VRASSRPLQVESQQLLQDLLVAEDGAASGGFYAFFAVPGEGSVSMVSRGMHAAEDGG
jgi:hypothetical protein